MKLPNITDPQSVISDLAPLVPVLHEALESGTLQAREYFDRENRSVDVSLYPCIVRYHAKHLLLQQENMGIFTTDDLANNGLSLSFGRYRIRILKSIHGDVPPPGISKRRQDFWQQPFDFVDELEPEAPQGSTINLLVVWDVTPSYNLKELRVACPKGGNLTVDSVETYWDERLPHPAEVGLNTKPEVRKVEDEDDLDISLPNEEIRTRQAG